MNEQERAFFQRLSAEGLTRNQARMIHGLLAGLTVREVGLPPTSTERTITELRKLNLIEKVKGRWRLAADVEGLFVVPPRPLGTVAVPPAASPTADVPPAPESGPLAPPPPGAATRPADPKPDSKPAFLRRPGAQQAQVIARMQVLGWAGAESLTDYCLRCRAAYTPPDADTGKLLTQAESLALQAFGPSP